MIDKIFPIYFYFFLGYILRKSKIFSADDGKVLLRFGIYVTTPALLLSTFSRKSLAIEDYKIAISAIVLFIAGYLIARIVAHLMKSPNPTKGTLIVSFMNYNTGVATAFLLSIFGTDIIISSEIIGRIHSLILFSIVYYFAAMFGGKQINKRLALKKMFSMPPLWAFLIGMAIFYSNIQIPTFILSPLEVIGSFSVIVFTLGTGLNIEFSIKHFASVFKIVATRYVFFITLAFLLIYLLQIDARGAFVILLFTLAPVGANTITYSVLENLDLNLAQKLVSASLIISLILMTIASFVGVNNFGF